MTTLLGALTGLVGGVGVWIVIAGLTGIEVRERVHARQDWSRLWWRITTAIAGWLVAWWVTGWPMAGVLAAGAVWMVPLLIDARTARTAASAKTEALASWAEMLRDTISAHAALNQAIAITAAVAPEAIRVEVRALASRAERQSLSSALRLFAAEVADPVADLIVSALVIADQRQAQKLTDLLAGIAGSARNQAAMRLRVETGRARTYASSQALVFITLLMVVILMVMSPKFLAPFNTWVGQLVMGVIGLLFGGALWSLVRLGRPAETPRLLAGIQEEGIGS